MRTCVLLLAFVALISSCANDPAKVKSFTQSKKLPLQTAHDVDVLYSDSARLKIHLTAPQVDDYMGQETYTEMPKGVKVEFFNDSGKLDSYLTSNYAIRNQRQNMMEARNNVVVVNNRGERLNTEDLIWDGTKRRIHTDAYVTITTADQVIYGTGLESDEMFTDYEIKNVKGKVRLKEGPDEDQ